jgi:hypothetical protein
MGAPDKNCSQMDSYLLGAGILRVCGKTLSVEVLKGHGFPAVPYVIENDARRG